MNIKSFKLKRILFYPLIFLCVLSVCVGCISASAMIPRKYIMENSQKSAEYYVQNGKFEEALIKDKNNTIVDNYADVILLNIIYCLDSSTPIESAVSAKYYADKTGDVLNSYKEVTSNDKLHANIYYSRYWHGTMVILKPLLIITDIHGIRIFNIFLIIVLTLVLLMMLAKEKEIILCISIICGMFICGIYTVPFCIEYMSAFAVMLAGSIGVVVVMKKKEEYIGTVFLICGMLICFFDFLTSETITYTVPLIITLVLSFKKGKLKKFKDGILLVLKTGMLWGSGYVLMFVSKWLISSMFLHEKAIEEAVSNVSHRVNAAQTYLETSFSDNRFFKNIVMLNIFDNTTTYGDVLLRIFTIAFVIFCIGYLYNKKKIIESELFKVMAVIMVVPYLRYLFLNNHSQIHYFFTYRAQMPVIVIGIYMMLVSIDFNLIRKDIRKIKKIFREN